MENLNLFLAETYQYALFTIAIARMKAKMNLFRILLALGLISLPGCATQIVNLTPKQIPENPSSIYTFSCATEVKRPYLDKESIKTEIVVNGDRHTMLKSDIGENIFNLDYHLPPRLSKVRYYYVLTYQIKGANGSEEVELYSDLFRSDLINRYVIQLDTDRAPVGARVGLVGRGFSEHDVVTMGGQDVSTIFTSTNSIHFYVPSLPADKTYDVSLRTRDGSISAGKFRVDNAAISFLPSSLYLSSGERTIAIITIQFEAPPGGLFINVTTDVPSSVIMPEVLIPENSRSINISVEGGEPGTGTLYVEVPGFNSLQIPVSVY